MTDRNESWVLVDRIFSRIWRRSKHYTAGQIKHIAFRQGHTIKKEGQNQLTVVDRQGQPVAHFQRVPEPEEPAQERVEERLRLFASLK